MREAAASEQGQDLLARIERLEERARELSVAGAWKPAQPASPAPAGGLEALQAQAEAQARTLAELREELRQAASELASQTAGLQRVLAEAREQVPQLIASAAAGLAPERQDALRRQTAFMQKRLRDQFDAAVEEHAAQRTREVERQQGERQLAVAEMEKQAAAAEAKLAELQATFADLTVEAARIPERNQREESRPWYRTWRVAVLALALLVLAGAAWRSGKRPGLAAPVSETALLDQAGEAAVQKDYARAEGLYREILRRNPKQEEALRGLGTTLLLDSESVMHGLP